MSHEVKITRNGQRLDVVTAGNLTAAEFHTMIAEVGEICQRKGIAQVLINHAEAHVHGLTVAEIQGVAQLCTTINEALSGGRVAVLMADDLDYGLARMWLTYTADLLSYESALFRDFAEAVAWLDNPA